MRGDPLRATAFDAALQDAFGVSQVQVEASEGGEAASEEALGEGTVNLEPSSPGFCRRLAKVLATSKDLDDGTEPMW